MPDRTPWLRERAANEHDVQVTLGRRTDYLPTLEFCRALVSTNVAAMESASFLPSAADTCLPSKLVQSALWFGWMNEIPPLVCMMHSRNWTPARERRDLGRERYTHLWSARSPFWPTTTHGTLAIPLCMISLSCTSRTSSNEGRLVTE